MSEEYERLTEDGYIELRKKLCPPIESSTGKSDIHFKTEEFVRIPNTDNYQYSLLVIQPKKHRKAP